MIIWKNVRCEIMYLIKTKFVLLFLVAACTGFAQQTDFKSCGIDDIDQVRRNVKIRPTTEDNALSRKAALYRWWRLMLNQGYDMDAFDEVAEQLLNLPDSTLQGRESVTTGFMKLEEMMRRGKKIPEIKGTKSTKSSTVTNWPLYHGTDATQDGYSPDEGPSSGRIVWTFPKSYGCNICPVVESGKVYIPCIGDDVVACCLDEATGRVIWKGRKYGTNYYNNARVTQSAIVAGNRMLVMTWSVLDKMTGSLVSQSNLFSDAVTRMTAHPRVVKAALKYLVAIDAQTGKPVRKFYSQKSIFGQPVLFSRYVYYITDDGALHAAGLDNENENWQKSYDHVLVGTPSINEDGTVYVGSNEGCLLAVDAGNGDLKWTFKTDLLEPRAKRLFTDVLVCGDTLYVGSAGKKVYCLNAADGTLNWEFAVDDWVRSKPFFTDGSLYVTTMSGTMYAIGNRSNSPPPLRWQEKIAEHGFTANLTGSDKGILGVSQNQMLYSICPETGQIQWRHGLMDGTFINDTFYSSEEIGGQQSSPVVVDGVLYIGGTDGFVNAVDVESGTEKWRFETDGIMASSPTVAFDKVFFGEAYDTDGTYYALDRSTGKPIWTSADYGEVWINATFDDKRIYFGNREGVFFAVDPNNGKMIWQYNTAKDTPLENIEPGQAPRHGYPPGVYCNPVYRDGVVYTGSWTGYYFAFDADNGQLRWRIKTKPDEDDGGRPDSAAPVLYKNHLYVQKAGYQIAAVNIKTGLIDWEWTAPAGYLQNGTITAFDNKIFGSIIRSVTDLPYDASIIAFGDVENGGKERWRYQGGGGLTAAVATNDKLIFGSSGDVFITCLDPENGQVKWRTYTGGVMLESVPAIYSNKAFVQCKNGYIYAFE
jgi:outer membrane protein assembly factor BamB